MDNDIRQHQRRRHVIGVAYKPHAVFQPQAFNAGFQFSAKGRAFFRIADQQGKRIAGQPRHGFHQHHLPLPARDARRQHDDRAAFGQAPGSAELFEPFGADQARVEAPRVNTAWDHAQARFLHPMPGADQISDEMADGNHAITARHDGIVESLASKALIISAVIGGDEGQPSASGRHQCRPGRRTGTRMDQRNPFRPRQRAQRRRIAPQGEGRFGRQRQGDVLGAQSFQGRHHLPTRRGDYGAKPRGDLCLGNLKRAAFHAPGAERG